MHVSDELVMSVTINAPDRVSSNSFRCECEWKLTGMSTESAEKKNRHTFRPNDLALNEDKLYGDFEKMLSIPLDEELEQPMK